MAQNLVQPTLVEQARVACRDILEVSVGKLNQKYRKEYYVSRTQAEQVFQRFSESNKELFLVLGDSGHGKTNLMCHLAQLSMQTRPTLFLMGMWRADRQQSIFDYIFGDLKARVGLEKTEVTRFINSLDKELQRSNSYVLVVIDGINETEDTSWVKAGLRELLTKCPKTFRFAISCRIDSFRLHFPDTFWADYVYQDGPVLQKTDEDVRFEEVLKAQAKSPINRMLTPEQRRVVEEALTREHKAQQLRRAARLRELATEGSIFLPQFNEVEFSDALSKYRINATLVGEALAHTHDPLVFRFFADTVGKEAREVSDVFTLENSQQYLRKHLNEATARGYDQEVAKVLLFALASDCRKQYLKGSQGVDQSHLKAHDRVLVNLFMESGLLISVGDTKRAKILFTYDRVLSFVLALEASELGADGIAERLGEISRVKDPPAIDLHQCIYLLLFNEQYGAMDEGRLRDWIRRFLDRPAFRAQVVQALPEFRSWKVPMILDEVKQLLIKMPTRRSIDQVLSQDRPYASTHKQYNRYYFAGQSESLDLIKACSEALSTLARKGHGSDVVRLVGTFLSYCPSDEQVWFFYPLVKPMAVSFPSDPDQCMQILRLLCDSQEETNLNVMISTPIEEGEPLLIGREEQSRRNETVDGLSLLQQEISSFPQARLSLIKRLAASSWVGFRTVSSSALVGLFMQDREEARRLIDELVQDNDFRVRAALSQVAVELYEIDRGAASTLCEKLLEDRDEKVRAALVDSTVRLLSEGRVSIDLLSAPLYSALNDGSTYIRSKLATEMVRALSGRSLAEPTADLLTTLVRVLAMDKSYLVKTAVTREASKSIAQSPELWIDGITNSITEETPNSFRIMLVESLLDSVIQWDSIPEQAVKLATLLANDTSDLIRAKAIYLLARMADQGNPRIKELLKQLVDDPNVLVRLEALEAQHSRPSKTLSELILKGGEQPLAANPRRTWLEQRYLNLLVDGKIHALKGRELLERFLRNVGAVGLLIPCFALIGITGWDVSWLGYLGPGRYTSDPRYSMVPIVIGMFVATVVLHAQRWLDLHYYSRRVVAVLRSVWPYLLTPILLSLAAAIGASRFAGVRVSLLVGLSTLTVTLSLASLIFGLRHNLVSPPWSAQSIAYMLAVGYSCGLMGGWLAEQTRESFYGFFMLLCPLLLNFRLRRKHQGTILAVVIASLSVSSLPFLAAALNKWEFVTNAEVYQWMILHIGNRAASAAVLGIFGALLYVIGVLIDDEPEGVAYSTVLLLVIIIGSRFLLSMSWGDAFLMAMTAFTLSLLYWQESKSRMLAVGYASYLVSLYGQSFVKSPWLLPGLGLLGVSLFLVLYWSAPTRDDSLFDADRFQRELIFQNSMRRLIRLAFIMIPTICCLVILITSALFSLPKVQAAITWQTSTISLAIVFGFITLYFQPDFDLAIQAKSLNYFIPLGFVLLTTFCLIMLLYGHSRNAFRLFVIVLLCCLALALRSVSKNIERLPLLVALVIMPPLAVNLFDRGVSLYLSYVGALVFLLIITFRRNHKAAYVQTV